MTWPIVAVVVVVLILIVLFVLSRRRKQQRTGQLRERFGPEYDRTVEREGKRKRAEEDLERRAEERDKVEIRELDPAARERFAHRWDEAQHLFVDDPAAAIQQADVLVHEVMRDARLPGRRLRAQRRRPVGRSAPSRGALPRRPRRRPAAPGARRSRPRTSARPWCTSAGLFDELLGTSRSAAHGATERSAVPAGAQRDEDREGVRREAPLTERDPGMDPERPGPDDGARRPAPRH